MTVFQSYEWYEKLNEQFLSHAFEKSSKVSYILLYDDGVPAMIAPIFIKKHGISYKDFGISKGIYIFGSWGYTDYLNFIYNDFDSENFEQIHSYILSAYPGYKIYLDQIPDNTQLNAFLASDYTPSFRFSASCLSIFPKTSFEEYHKGLSKSVRQNIRTANNRAAKDGLQIKTELHSCVDEKTAGLLYDIYKKRNISLNSTTKSGSLKSKIISAYYRNYNQKLQKRLSCFNYMTQSMIHDERSCTLIINIGADIAGFCYGLWDKPKNTVRFMMVSLNENYSKYSPCMAGLFEFIKNSYNNPKPFTVDLTRGNEKYKYNLGGQECFVNYFMLKK
jgi:hypothetical protein